MDNFTKQLLSWYEAQKRDLPWRREPTPYRVWISEVMLQQTTVPAVAGRFEKWMARFPCIKSLAAAGERDVLLEWEGLGYYQRAARLHAAARSIVSEHDGQLPQDEQLLRRLPGIGPYIASAIRSLAFGKDTVAVDVNVCRVFMRLLALEGAPGESRVRRTVENAAYGILPAGDSSRFNQALMDFGSIICRASRPECDRCFAVANCRAFQEGLQNDIPGKRRKKLEEIETAVAVFLDGDSVYIQKRPRDGLFGGMWEFPGGKVKEKEPVSGAVVREVAEELRVGCRVREKVTSFVHFYTRYKVTLHAFLCSCEDDLPLDDEHRWVEVKSLSRYPMPSANRKLIERIRRRSGT